jgi:RecA-family ATPase
MKIVSLADLKARTAPAAYDIRPVRLRPELFPPATRFDGLPVPPRRWLVPDWVPMGTVTLLSGDGGVGKSLLALQLAVATATGRAWLGRPLDEHGPALFLSAEDDEAELHRRLWDIARAEGLTWADLADLRPVSLAGQDALLAVLESGGTLKPTALYEAIDAAMGEHAPRLVVLDTLADLFPGDENSRTQARQFVGMLRGLAIRHEAAVALLSHPSLSGLNSGSGTSGSTAWNNSVRSRLYFERVTTRDGLTVIEDDPDRRVLRGMKNNYAARGAEITMRWEGGVFVAEAAPEGLDRKAAEAKAERVFLRLLDEFAAEGRAVRSANAAGYAPKVFASSGRAEGLSKEALRVAMERLFSRGAIREEPGGNGPPSKRTMRIVRVETGAE